MAKYSYKKNHPFRTFLIVLLIILLCVAVFGLLWWFSDGFTDWSAFKAEEDEEVLEDGDIALDDDDPGEDVVDDLGGDNNEDEPSDYVFKVE